MFVNTMFKGRTTRNGKYQLFTLLWKQTLYISTASENSQH